MEYVYHYLLFAAECLTVVLALAIPVLTILVLRSRQGSPDGAIITVRKLNDQRQQARLAIESALLSPKALKQHLKTLRKAEKEAAALPPDERQRRLFVCQFTGDLRATAVNALREEISAILSVARAADEVVVVLESAGGTIHGYGLAASQLRRVRDQGVALTVIVDKIAASGGYMMACVADTIVAAPFAIIGSIGVVAQLPNFNRMLRKHDIDFEQIMAGKHKRTLTLFGENTEAGREKFQEEINDAHSLFKEFIQRHRPRLDIERVATGEYWFGTRALEFGLVDRLATSDEYIGTRLTDFSAYRVTAEIPKSWPQKLLARARAAFPLA